MKMKNLLIIMSILLVVSACASTRSYRDVEKSGFLGSDAAKLKKGDKDQPALVYLKPGVDWASYNKMLLDPVTFWRPPETKNQGVSHQDIQTVVDYFYPLIYQKFSQQMEMVKIPRRDALTGELLYECVAARVGGKTLDAKHFESWGEVDEAMQYWVNQAAYRLCMMRKKSDCVKPD